MSIDISRTLTDFRKSYRGVRMQQGRVLTDDDFNESQALDAEDIRRTRTDTIGSLGSPDAGFLPKNFAIEAAGITFTLSAGTLYLGGHRLELQNDQAFTLQTNWLDFDAASSRPGAPANGRRDLVWIEAWEQPVTATEDASLLEVALGGPDTTARVRLMYRVHVSAGVARDTCAAVWRSLATTFSGSAGSLNAERELITTTRMKVAFNTPAVSGNLCSPAIAGGYLGAENQAIRVQLVDSTHYTWGFDNAAPLYRVRVATDRRTLTFLTPPRDAAHWPMMNQVVEVLPWSAALSNGQRLAELSGHLDKVGASYDPDSRTLALTTALPTSFNTRAKARSDRTHYWDGTSDDDYVYLRVWNRGDDLASPAAIPLPLGASDPNGRLGNTGYSVLFSGGPLRANDHWLISARPAAPDGILPAELGIGSGAAPLAMRRFRAPLALIEWATESDAPPAQVLHDCRHPYVPLAQQRCCKRLVAEPGWGWERIFDEVPQRGDASICFPAGDYPVAGTVRVEGRGRLLLSGEGKASRLTGTSSDALLVFSACDAVSLRDLYLFGGNQHEPGIQGTLTLEDVRSIDLDGVTLRCRGGRSRETACLRVRGTPSDGRRLPAVRIARCEFYPGHLQIGVLVTDSRSVIVQDCRFAPSGPQVESVEYALRDDRFRDALAQSALVIVPTTAQPQRIVIAVDDGDIVFAADRAARPAIITRFVGSAPLQNHSVKAPGLLRVHLMRRIRSLLGSRHGRQRLAEWLEAIDRGAKAVMSQAIVVGGSVAERVIVEKNEIGAAVQGIHVGLSHEGAARTESAADHAVHVVVRDNAVECVVPAGAGGERHGIFVGNVHAAVVSGNRVSLERLPGLRNLPVDGIRVFGFSGELIQVYSNHVGSFTRSIWLEQRGATPTNAAQRAEHNFPESG